MCKHRKNAHEGLRNHYCINGQSHNKYTCGKKYPAIQGFQRMMSQTAAHINIIISMMHNMDTPK